MRLPIVFLLAAGLAAAAPRFELSAESIETYGFVEVTVRTVPFAGNPFTSAALDGTFGLEGELRTPVSGFCDSPDGAVFRIRFLPERAGEYAYSVTLHTPAGDSLSKGRFRATPSSRRGLVRVDTAYPNHFVWAGTGEHFYWTGLTTYALMGWQDEGYIHSIIDRAARLKINRLRVTLNGPRVPDASRWYEPVKPSEKFRFLFGPWVAADPDNIANPQWDVNRYDVAYWQKFERVVRYARELDVVISVIFFLDGADAGADPFGKPNRFSEAEQRYYRYGVSRLAAYSNVMWDITNEWHLFRDAWWVERMGTLVKSLDPYKHLASCHGRGDFPWMLSEWADFAMFQLWDEDGAYAPMLKRRQAQAATGRPMPQINEEYGYEDHYPAKWGGNRRPPARSADNRRRQAWEIAMAGCYQTTGERANRGDGEAPATPGGWINGGFDASMTMLEGYARMVDFFTGFDYWKLTPAPDSASGGVLLLAESGQRYVIYYPKAARGEVKLQPGKYRGRWFDPRSGSWSEAGDVSADGGGWKYPQPTAEGDWVLLVERRGS